MLTTKLPAVRLAGVLWMTLSALNAQSVNSSVTVPRTVRYSGSFHPADGLAVQPMEGMTVAVYAQQTGGDALWQETQNVQVDTSGNFAVEMGATQNDGLPLDLLRTGEPRWVGIRVNRPGESEQPRVRLLSVPYALRASDAETLGGIPASAYLKDPSVPAAGSGSSTAATVSASTNAVKPRVTSGTTNYLGVFTNGTDLGNSVLYQSGAKIGLNTATPLDYLHVRFTDTSGGFTGYAVQNLGSGAAAYSGMLFYDQNGALGQFQGFNNSTHEYRINNVALGGSINFMLGSASKFQVRSDGDIDAPGSLRKSGTLFLHNIGPNNTAVGIGALPPPSTGANNAAVGYQALFSNSSGSLNTAIGTGALGSNTTGTYNTAIGGAALNSNTTGSSNTASGAYALLSNTGNGNTANGEAALFNNAGGSNNTASGINALGTNITGSSNIAIGEKAGYLIVGSYNIAIGSQGDAADNGFIRIGTPGTHTLFAAAGIWGKQTNPGPVPVVIDQYGVMGTISSSRRYKEDIEDMSDTSSDLLRLRPVTFRYKKPYADGSKPLEYGLIAEEVADVYPDLVVTNKDGQVETVQYQKLTPMLLNELQKQNETIRMLKAQIREQQEQNGKLESRLAALETLLSGGKVSNSAIAAR